MLSIRGNDLIACWAYAEPISSHAEHTRNEFPRMLSQRSNVNIFTCTIHAEHTRNEFYRTLSIRGTNFIACWAYWETISSHAERARKCLKVEYLSRIEHDFQKSRVTGPWDHEDLVSAKKVYKKLHACVPLSRIIDISAVGSTNGLFNYCRPPIGSSPKLSTSVGLL
jgi:hypothetical protein